MNFLPPYSWHYYLVDIYNFQKSNKDTGTGFVCSQSSCGCHVSSSEVSHRLQEIRANLEKAVDLMEGERPGKKQWRSVFHLDLIILAIRSASVSYIFMLFFFSAFPQIMLWGCWKGLSVSRDSSLQRHILYRGSWMMLRPELMLPWVRI